MMVKIYCIEDINDLKYIGSTSQTINKRLNNHRFKKRCSGNTTSNQLNLEYCVVYELEECDEYDRNERERYWMEQIPCVNKHIPGGQSQELLKSKEKVYRENNTDRKRLYDIEYRRKNKERLLSQKKEYRDGLENKDYQKNYHKDYQKKHKEKKKEQDRIRYLNKKKILYSI